MKEFIKKNFALLLAFSLPIILILGIAVSAYLPSFFISTSYNFIYATCSDGRDYYYSDHCNDYLSKHYAVVNNKLVENYVDMAQYTNKNDSTNPSEKYTGRIFLYDTKKNESREITLTEAQTLTLNNLLTSPDGITVSSDYSYSGSSDFFPFGGGHSSYGYYLTKGKSKSKINLINNSDRYYYQNNFQFVGWVLPGRN
jgi:hypothetical protein